MALSQNSVFLRDIKRAGAVFFKRTWMVMPGFFFGSPVSERTTENNFAETWGELTGLVLNFSSTFLFIGCQHRILNSRLFRRRPGESPA